MKKNFRRILAMILTIAMVVSMVGAIPVFAVEENSEPQIHGTTDPDYYVVNEGTSTKLDGSVPESTVDYANDGMKSVEDGAVQVSKTIEPTGTENQFNITLKVTTTEQIENLTLSDNAAVVLVIDNSSSMYQNLANRVDGQSDSAPLMDKRNNTNYASIPSSVGDGYLDYVKAVDKTKIPYIHSGRIPVAGNPKEDWRITLAKTAAKDFANDFMDATGKRYLSVVSFSTTAKLETDGENLGAKDTNGWTTKGTRATDAIDAMRPISFTNIDAGLRMAQDQLAKLPDDVTNRYVILLADGDANRSGVNGTDTNDARGRATATSAAIVNDGVPLYNVAFTEDASLSYLSGELYDAADLDTLIEKLDDIEQLIATQAMAWTVTDPMGQCILLDSDISALNKDTKKNNATGKAVVADGTGFTWNLQNSKVNTTHDDTTNTTYFNYTLPYTITLNTDDANFKATENGKDVYYLTNRETTLNYRITKTTTNNNNKVEEKIEDGTVNFDVPAVKGEYPSYIYTVNHYLQTGVEDGIIVYSPTPVVTYTVSEGVKKFDIARNEAYDTTGVGTNTYANYTYEKFEANGGTKEQIDAYNAKNFAGGITITTNGQELNFFYTKNTTEATVKHYFYDVTLTNSGETYTLNEDLTNSYNATPTTHGLFVADRFTGNAAGTGGTVTTDGNVQYVLGNSNEGAKLGTIKKATNPEEAIEITLADILEAKPDENTINFYYFSEEVDNQTTYNVDVKYEYTLNTWELVGGAYVPKEIKADGTGNSVTGVTYGSSFTANPGNTGTYADYEYVTDGTTHTSTTNGLTITPVENADPTVAIPFVKANDTITIKYEKDVPLEDFADDADVAIIHKYFLRTEMVDANGTHLNYEADVPDGENYIDEEVLRTYYVDETLTATEHPNYNGNKYTFDTISVTNNQKDGDDHSLTVTANELNTITLTYYRIEKETKLTNAQVKHVYTYNYEDVIDGVVTDCYTITDDTEDIVKGRPVGDDFRADLQELNPNDGRSYNPVSIETNTASDVSVTSDPKDLSIILENRDLNTITIYYVLNEDPLARNANAEVDHTYCTYVYNYVKGKSIKVDTIEEFGERYTIKGAVDEEVSADAIFDFVGTSGYTGAFTEKDGYTQQSKILVANQTQYMHFNYERDVYAYEEAGVTVNHHYYTKHTYINDDGDRIVDEITNEFSNLGTLQTTLNDLPLYGGMAFSTDGVYDIASTDAAGNPITVTYGLDTEKSDEFALFLAPNMNNVIDLYYFIEDDETTKTDVQEYHHYQTTTITLGSDGLPETHKSGYITNEEQTKDEDIWVEQTYSALPNATNLTKVETMVDGAAVPLAPVDGKYTITAINGVNQIDFYYDTINDYTDPANLIVNHHYTTYYADGTVGNNEGTPDRLSSYATVTHGYSEKTGDFGGNFEVVNTTNTKGTLNTTAKTIVLDAGENVIDIYYERTVENRTPTTVTVVYEYYFNDTTFEGRESDTYTGIYFNEGETYTVAIDDVRNFTASEAFDYNYKSGANTITLVQDGKENVITLIYNRVVEEPDEPDVPDTPNPPSTTYYTLRINWVDEDGNALADQEKTTRLRYSDEYTTEQKEFAGYTFLMMAEDSDPVSGTMKGNREVTYVYTPVTDIPDTDIPLEEIPETPEDPTTPDVDIPEVDVPLTDIPDEDVPLTEIPDMEVPLGDTPDTGDSRTATTFLLTAALSAAGLVWLLKMELDEKKKRKQSEQ